MLGSLFARKNSQNHLITIAILILCLILIALPPIYNSPYARETLRVRGKVMSVDNSAIQQFGIIRQGDQSLQVRVEEGKYKGTVVDAGNNLIGKMDIDKFFAVNDDVYLVLDEQAGQIIAATAYDFYRMDTQILLLIAFIVCFICFGGWTGFRALVSFVFAVLVIYKIMLPGLLAGWNPVGLAFGIITACTLVTMILVAGFTRTALVSSLGSLLGVCLTIVLSVVLMPMFHLNGAMQPYAETLLYSGFPNLDINNIFIAAVFIGASGAVMDLAIDVAASINEVCTKRPDLSFWEIAKSGISVGRAMTGTMITTLFMAYVSGYIALLMVFFAQGIDPIQMINTGYISAEIMRTIVGSFGLVTVAPFTALVGGFVYSHKSAKVYAHEPQQAEPAMEN